MPNASDISDSIEPGSLEYGDRQVVTERIQQASNQRSQPATPGAATAAAQGRLASGPVSDLPVTDGLSVGPGANGLPANAVAESPDVQKFRLLALNARNPVIRKLARDALRATLSRSS